MVVHQDIWNSFWDVMEYLRETCPGGYPGCVVISLVSIVTYKVVANYLHSGKVNKVINARRRIALATIEKTRQMLKTTKEPIDVSITELPFVELQAKLKSGQLSCLEVLLAYQSKALELHDKTNCVTEFLTNAIDRARQLDALQPSEREQLHGIPISLKETVGVAGHDATAGMAYFIGKIHKDNSVMLSALMKQGAIPFARTNISQGLISYSCSNPLYGETSHPHKAGRSCGGSSGGEGVLLAGKGSILGIGCDMGGSNRIPAHVCGACGFKPTADRMSSAGNFPLGHGIMTVREVYGPLGRDVASLVAFMKAGLEPEMFRLDPIIPRIPWRDEMYNNKSPMKIGFYVCDGGVEPVPAVRRAVLKAVACLEKLGHNVVAFNPPDVLNAVNDFAIAALLGDNGKTADVTLKDDFVDPCISGSVNLPLLPYSLRWLLSKLLFFLHPVEKKMLAVKLPSNVYEWWQKNEEKDAYKRKFVSAMQAQGIQALICPTFPVPAWNIKDDSQSYAFGTYTALYNALEFPCGSVFVTQVNDEDIKNMESYPKAYGMDKYVHRISKGSENLPLGVQCVGLPFQEETVLRLMTEIEAGTK